MMINNSMRTFIVNNWYQLNTLTITHQQRYVLTLVQNKPGMSASDLAELMPVEISYAGIILQNLFKLGYLSRIKQSLPTGGIYYKYTTTVKVN